MEIKLSRKSGRVLIYGILAIAFIISTNVHAAVDDEIASRQKQIEEIQRQIDEYEKQIEQTQSTSKTLEGAIKGLNSKIGQLTLEIKSLELSIKQTVSAIGDAENKISDANSKILKHRGALAQYLKAIYETDQKSLTEVLLKNANLSDFFTDINNIRTNQDNLQLVIEDIRDLRQDIEEEQDNLEDKKTELERAKRLQDIEKRSIDSAKAAQAKLLKDTKGQESKYQELVKKSQRDIEAIRAQIGYLEQSGITAEEAVKFAQLAAIRSGIRPAFLLALLEWETGMGRNVGKCNIVDTTSGASRHVTTGKVSAKGIHPTRDLPLLLTVTSELGMDPMQTPISCWPGYGYGGAMGPAQFIPSTWMGYREEVSKLTGHNPANPWVVEDAFTASAIYLARRGATAQTRAAEIAAAKGYISGNSKCSTAACNSYANGIQRLAAEIEKNL